MRSFSRRHFIKLLAAAPAAFAQSPKIPADDVVVSHDELRSLAAFQWQFVGQAAREASRAPNEDILSVLIKKFQRDEVSRGYPEKPTPVGALYILDGDLALSFRAGNQGVIGIGKGYLPNPLFVQTEEAHEFGHLYFRHQPNVLAGLHPEINAARSPALAKLQRKFKHLFDQVNVPYEKALAKNQISYREQEYQAEQFAVRETCVPELPQQFADKLLSVIDRGKQSGVRQPFFDLTPEAQARARDVMLRTREADYTPLPPVCRFVRVAAGLSPTPKLP